MIRAGIVSIIRRLAPQWHVSECKDAESAMQSLNSDKPDLMLIDVSMPGMDGLELAHFLKEKFPDILKIVLTGHDKFSYVQNALRAEVLDYLLKPIIREELVEALEKAERLIGERVHNRQQAAEARAQRLQHSLVDLLCGLQESEDQLKRILIEEGWQLESVEYSLLVFVGDDDGFIGQGEKLSQRVEAFQSIFGQEDHTFAFFSDSRHFFVFSSGTALPVDDMWGWWLRTWSSTTTDASLGGEALIWGGGASFVSLAELPEVYGNLIHQMNRSENGRKKPDTVNGANKDRIDQENRLRAALETNDFEALMNFFQAGFKKIKQQASEQPSMMRLGMFHFLLLILLPVLTKTESKLSLAMRETVADVLSRLSLPGSTIHLMSIISEFENQLRTLATHLPDNTEQNKVIETVKAYIGKNYADKTLCLETLSKVVHMNGNYVSNLFKEVTGENYLVYLTSARMEQAKRMLRDTTLKTYEVADSTGYSSTKYFCKVFRKMHGMTPSEYRNRSQGSEGSDKTSVD
nr:helix-turn-helix domain-containing protein [Cohnella sp. WQ 127256]